MGTEAPSRPARQGYQDLLDGRLARLADVLGEMDEGGDRDALSGQLSGIFSDLDEADIADALETLPLSQRSIAAECIPDGRLVRVINDMSEAAAGATMSELADGRLVSAVKSCEDVEEVEDLLRSLPPKRRSEILHASGLSGDVRLLKSLAFAPGTVGEMMDFLTVSVEPGMTLGEVSKMLRGRGELPPKSDKLFVTEDGKLTGVLPLKKIVMKDPGDRVGDVMVSRRIHVLRPSEGVEEASDLFERYDLVSAPVVGDDNSLMGRVTVDEVLYRAREERHAYLLSASGHQDEEDLYESIWSKLRNRGFWIFINLITAFLVSRVIGSFEATIVQVVALASLMPIIASMAGNTGMQTATVVIRALALNQISSRNWHALLGKELMLGIVNGLVWGSLVGVFGLVFYLDPKLAAVLAGSMIAVFVLAAALGFIVPVTVNHLKQDPALGTSVIVTTVLDCLGFFIFLSLAAALLV